MRVQSNLTLFLLAASMMLISCLNSDIHREDSKIFHAGPSSGGIGSMYFSLYKDGTYHFCNSGGIGEICYSGKFNLNKDTILLNELNKDIRIASNRLIIKRYAEQDSTYWIWKYENSSRALKWVDFRRQDSLINTIGDVYLLDKENEPRKDETHFTIRLDSLKTYR